MKPCAQMTQLVFTSLTPGVRSLTAALGVDVRVHSRITNVAWMTRRWRVRNMPVWKGRCFVAR